uniref:DALR anticodon-binding domain-containing protein 3-like n=1 Tax=Oncorhynchus gorbuscha TaxID=8017 RepID=UPI001EAEFBA4|nr:DALR anticodon-binding domain-containing protein 3-like [Oncorhynchus gorbuscha]
MENIEETPFRITHTVQALGSALRGAPGNVPDANGLGSGDRISSETEKLWFKESSAKNLRNRDFLSPTTVLNTLYTDRFPQR